MIFTTSLDKLAKGVTIAVTFLFAFIIISQFMLVKEIGFVFPTSVCILLVFTYLLAFTFKPIHYKINNKQLVIHRFWNDVKIDFNTIKHIEYLDKEKMSWVVRTFGVGGMFGYFGQFYNAKIGSMTWYATRRNKTVLIITNNQKKIVLTPDEPEEFVMRLKHN